MRVASIVWAALAAAPLAVSATGQLGFSLGTNTSTNSCKTSDDYAKDLQALKGHTTIVRGYDASSCDFPATILPLAKQYGFTVILGIWPDTEDQFNNGLKAIQAVADQYGDQIDAITVGSETLYRKTFTADQLLNNYIKPVKKALSQFKVGTADSWNMYVKPDDAGAEAALAELIKGADLLLVNAFSYWQGQDITNATGSFFDDIMQATANIQKVRGSIDDIDIRVGETGWTTQGTTYKSAVPSVAHAQTFWKSGVCGMLDWGVDVFAFEAFDEAWKPDSISDTGTPADEKHWGVFDTNRKAKYDLTC